MSLYELLEFFLLKVRKNNNSNCLFLLFTTQPTLLKPGSKYIKIATATYSG